jgi:hypothetical protein
MSDENPLNRCLDKFSPGVGYLGEQEATCYLEKGHNGPHEGGDAGSIRGGRRRNDEPDADV